MRRKLRRSNKSSLQGGFGEADIAIFGAVSTAQWWLIIFPGAP
ncbi:MULTISPECIES: hypothetical protein [unclassified Bradyrhizobium]|nr:MULTISPECIES: hypothetical protein [unclassified Bradyrhizobium]